MLRAVYWVVQRRGKRKNWSVDCNTRPILISGSCKRETASNHTALLQAVVNATDSNQNLTRLRIISLASDGESR